MAPMLNSPVTKDGATYSRVQFAAIRLGDELFRRENGSTDFVSLGVVTAIKTARGNTKRARLGESNWITAKGWTSKKLWRKRAK